MLRSLMFSGWNIIYVIDCFGSISVRLQSNPVRPFNNQKGGLKIENVSNVN